MKKTAPAAVPVPFQPVFQIIAKQALTPARARPAKPAKAPPPPKAPWVMKEGTASIAGARLRGIAERTKATAGRATLTPRQVFKHAKPMAGVLPKKELLAMDNAIESSIGWASGNIVSWAFEEGYTFLGYPTLSQMAQIPEYRLISEVISTEATRKWIKIRSQSDDTAKSEKIDELEAEFERLSVRQKFRDLSLQDGFFGRSHLYIDTGDTDDQPELLTPIGDGNRYTEKKFRKGFLSELRVVEPIWCYPQWYNAQDPLQDGFYQPNIWYVMAKGVHVSRLMSFVSKPVPDLVKPAFSFGGLSMTQMAKPYVDNWLETRQNVNNIIQRFSQFVLKTDLEALLAKDAAGLAERVQTFVDTASVNNLLMLNKDTEEFGNVSVPLAGLDKLQAQALEHICSISRIPLVKYTGISPSGLNASSEGEIETFDDTIHSYQENFFDPNLQIVFRLAQINLWGKVDPDLIYEFNPLSELTEKEQGELQKMRSETHKNYVDMGAMDRSEVRQALADDVESPYEEIDVDDLPEIEVEPEHVRESIESGGGEGGDTPDAGGGEAAAASPDKEDDDGESD